MGLHRFLGMGYTTSNPLDLIQPLVSRCVGLFRKLPAYNLLHFLIVQSHVAPAIHAFYHTKFEQALVKATSHTKFSNYKRSVMKIALAVQAPVENASTPNNGITGTRNQLCSRKHHCVRATDFYHDFFVTWIYIGIFSHFPPIDHCDTRLKAIN